MGILYFTALSLYEWHILGYLIHINCMHKLIPSRGCLWGHYGSTSGCPENGYMIYIGLDIIYIIDLLLSPPSPKQWGNYMSKTKVYHPKEVKFLNILIMYAWESDPCLSKNMAYLMVKMLRKLWQFHVSSMLASSAAWGQKGWCRPWQQHPGHWSPPRGILQHG